MMEDIVQKLLNRYSSLQDKRGTTEQVWQEIADYFIANQDNITSVQSAGSNTKKRSLYESVGVHAADLLSSQLHSGLTNPSIKWFDLEMREKALQDDDITLFLQMAREVMLGIFNNSGSSFPAQNHEFILSLVTYGTACMFVENTDKSGLKFATVHMNNIFIKEDKYNDVDTVFRRMTLSKRQMMQRWGTKNHKTLCKCDESLGSDCACDLYEKDPDEDYEVLHAVVPAEESKVTKSKRFAYTSYYIDVKNSHLLSVGGYYENPYVVARLSKLAEETYGRSPAWSALPTMKMVNKMSESFIKATQLTYTPPLLLADDGVMMPLNAKPNGVIMGGLSMDGTPRVAPLNVGSNPDGILKTIAYYVQQVKDIFFVDQMSMESGNSYRTATEVMQIQNEKLKLLAPHIGRLQTEYLTKLISKVFNILARDGQLGKVPEALQVSDYDPIYVSPMAMLQKASEVMKFQQFLGVAAPLLQLNPTSLDFIDFDKLTRQIAADMGIWKSVQKSEEDVQAMREQQQQQQQMAQGLAAAQSVTESAGNATGAGMDLANIISTLQPKG